MLIYNITAHFLTDLKPFFGRFLLDIFLKFFISLYKKKLKKCAVVILMLRIT